MAGVTPQKALAAANIAMQGPFEWGERDCCTAACAAFAELWGVDPMDGFPRYSDMRGAVRFLDRFGGRDGCPDFMADSCGLVASDFRPGAICAAKVTPRRWALGVCISDGLVAFKGGDGVTFKVVDNGKFWVTECHR